MPEIIDILNTANPRDVIHRAVAMLADGALIGLPTESGYVLVAHGLHEQTVGKLATLGKSDPETILALCLKGREEASDFLPEMGPLAVRLANRCWPGPVTLTIPVKDHTGLLQALPQGTRDAVASHDEVRVQVPCGRICTRDSASAARASRRILGSKTQSDSDLSRIARRLLWNGRVINRRFRPFAIRSISNGCSRDERSLGGRPSWSGWRIHTQTSGEQYVSLCVHRKYVPQPNGRSAVSKIPRREVTMFRRRAGGTRVRRGLRGPRGGGGCSGELRIGRRPRFRGHRSARTFEPASYRSSA